MKRSAIMRCLFTFAVASTLASSLSLAADRSAITPRGEVPPPGSGEAAASVDWPPLIAAAAHRRRRSGVARGVVGEAGVR
ncbi:MAG: hypothetical protein R3F11_11990 [Verrucomicrobiales bacterium]